MLHTTLRPRLWIVSMAGAFALTATGFPTATAVDLEPLNVSYTCSAVSDASAVYIVHEPPVRAAAGQVVSMGTTSDSSFTVASGLTSGWSSFGGTVTTRPAGSSLGQRLTIAKTAVTAARTTAVIHGATLFRAVRPGPYSLQLGDIGHLRLQGYDSIGNKVGQRDFPSASGDMGPCRNIIGRTVVWRSGGTSAAITVVKDTTTTTARAAYSASRHRVAGSAKVRSHYGLKATGSVRFALRKGTRTIKTASATVSSTGVAKVVFARVKATGRYRIVGKYLGDSSLRSSHDASSWFTIG